MANKPTSTVNTLPVRIREILNRVCQDEYHRSNGVTPELLLGKGAARWLSKPRHQCFYEIYHGLKKSDGSRSFSTPQIGRWMNRDHSSVLHGILCYEAMIKEELAEPGLAA